MNKTCSKCNLSLDISNYNKNKRKADGLQTYCKLCSRLNSRAYYADNKEYHAAATRKRSDKVVKENRQRVYDIFTNSKCADCPERNILTFEFDHVRGVKVDCVTLLLKSGYCWETVKAEIDKCDIVCANCHRIRTMTRGNHWRVNMQLD